MVKNLDTKTPVSFVPMSDLGEREMFVKAKQMKALSVVYRGYTYFGNGDVVLAKVTPCFENGKAGIARNLKNDVGFGSSEYIILRPKDEILPEIVYGFIASYDFNHSGRKTMTGTGGLKRISTEFVAKYQVPLPNLNTQKQLVAEMEEQEAVIEANKKLVGIMEQKISNVLSEI